MAEGQKMPALPADVPALAAAGSSEEGGKPTWREVLVRTGFWKPCEVHGKETRGEDCVFCLDCYEVTCPSCKHGDEAGHRVLKIRRYNFRSAVLAVDVQALGVQVSKIQQYSINSQKVLYMRPIKRSKKFRPQAGARRCSTCRCYIRGEKKTYEFCSLVCEGKEDVSSDDFSGPEAEERLKNLHSKVEPPAAAEQGNEPRAIDNPPPAEEHGNEPVAIDNPPPAEELAIDNPPEAPNALPAANPRRMENSSFRRRPRKMVLPNRAPFF
ncbi:unnamed protein product [Urochloa decumbens]|uniref:PLATZ transcription factor family protein n=1 Tax=Urochloa decumbens TaxID=240449 RepID=A0ABC8XSI8_9POAL